MSESVHRLVYYSRNRVVGPEALAEAIENILSTSRRNNAKVGVTGALMFNSGCFAQVLEGDQASVERVFERIQQDDRHGDVILLDFSPAPGRAFQNWSMAFVGGSAPDSKRFDSIAGQTAYDPSLMTGNALFETLYRLALEDENAPS